ncbi:hypothetical protein RJ55_03517 [Drechmeria coniospora]|nr:hypothetical protein RJ55_03517 [Drechmeria coniospora]
MMTMKPVDTDALPTNALPTDALPTDASAGQGQPPLKAPHEPTEHGWEALAPAAPAGRGDGVPRRGASVPAVLRPGQGRLPAESVDEAWHEDGERAAAPSHERAPDSSRPGTNPFLKRKPVPRSAPPVDSFANLGLDAVHETAGGAPWPSEPQPAAVESHAWAGDGPEILCPQPVKGVPVLLSLPHDDDASGSLDEATEGPDPSGRRSRPLDDWSLIDVDPPNPPVPPAKRTPDAAADKPPLPRRTNGQASWNPSRQAVDGDAETYQVKQIRWRDDRSARPLRTSPILVQNQNGPCPLLALVNALTLTTPADGPDAGLVRVLRSRERISLNLLLDAVLDELMSPRRTTSEDALPDVGALYAFLRSLHTGMNVNPRFVPTVDGGGGGGAVMPGTFEETAEMKLYAAFSIPLLHGWLPAEDESAHESLRRRATSYEEVQNLLFREEELQEKLVNSEAGLIDAEQALYRDIATIKIFLAESATQLTRRGIDVIGTAMRPGTFAILFRNDHFSTLYCHPRSRRLLTLVTDAGYGGHEEVVWESLVDVKGERTEFLSGDFRVVGGTGAGSEGEGTTGEPTSARSSSGEGRGQDDEPALTPLEQEDRDLALALQLQEEEDQRHDEQQARRRRESILSEQYIERQAHRPETVVRSQWNVYSGTTVGIAPARRSSHTATTTATATTATTAATTATTTATTTANSTGASGGGARPALQQVRSLVPPPRPGAGWQADAEGDDAPPTYEQAAMDRAFVPPVGHPNHAGSSAEEVRPTTRVSPRPGRQPASRVASGRRPPVSPAAAGGSRERDCVVM